MTENEISREIVDAAFQVHNKLGPGLLETVYEVVGDTAQISCGAWPGQPRSPKLQFAKGDVVSSLIRTKNGCTIVLQHNVSTPRPYNRVNLIQGTKGIFRGYPDRIYLKGKTQGDEYESASKYQAEYEHPLWKNLASEASGGGMRGWTTWRIID